MAGHSNGTWTARNREPVGLSQAMLDVMLEDVWNDLAPLASTFDRLEWKHVKDTLESLRRVMKYRATGGGCAPPQH